MGGKHCCVVGCHNSNEKTKNNLTRISYFSFPQDKEWRSKLIAAVNRSDIFFNPNTSHICSVHFEEKNLLFHGKGFKLIPGSLPTLYMPKKTIETPCPPPRHPPATRYLLQQGVPYVLSNVFCQDPLEEHFGRHRGLGTRHDNPTIHQFGYQENQLRIQRSLAFNFVPKGNTAGRAGEKRPIVITNSPLKRLKHN
ncbi:uncharacterized protein LOC125653769 [Ostrea edulis]|uniref:uncharacterized protein LOC125653769 n=1 Tax=Ostrea edulis TaxID=37623 RepID=UPI0024AF16E0|nr:uncharacterized protein LOC125653769 [Ostrea edulis]